MLPITWEASDRSACNIATTTARIPPEIWDNVLSFLDNGWESDLKACAATCRAWQAASQRLLFRDFLLHDDAHAQAVLNLAERAPHLVAHIRILSVRTFGDLERHWVTLSRTLPALVPHLHRVTALNILTDTAIIRTQTCIFGPLFGQLHSITELSVSEFGQATWGGEEKNTLAVFLNYFPGLQSLFMRTVTGISYQPDDEVTVLSTTGPAFSLKTLHLGGCSDFWTLAWLLRAPYSLRRLRLAGVGGGEVEDIKRILSVVGANLLELSIYEHSMCSAQTSMVSSILAHADKVCTGLYQLHIGRFEANKILGSSQTTYAFNHCSPSQMLAGVAMGSLVHLSLGLCLVGDDGNQTDTEACDWGRLDQLLSRSFAKLRQVVIDVSPEGSTEGRLSLEKRIRDAMPWLSASLVLEMTFSQF